jgi:type II secretory pathway pseudopilin PulG
LELIVVIAIIIILSAIAIPNIVTAREGYTLLIATDVLTQQFNRCRQEAVRVNNRMKVKVTASTIQLDSNRDDVFDTNDTPAVSISEEATVTAMAPDTGIVEFTSRGEIPVGSAPSFTVSIGTRSRVVTIDPRGSVRVGPEIVG